MSLQLPFFSPQKTDCFRKLGYTVCELLSSQLNSSNIRILVTEWGKNTTCVIYYNVIFTTSINTILDQYSIQFNRVHNSHVYILLRFAISITLSSRNLIRLMPEKLWRRKSGIMHKSSVQFSIKPLQPPFRYQESKTAISLHN